MQLNGFKYCYLTQIILLQINHLFVQLVSCFQAGKGKKQKIPRTKNYGRKLRRWHSAYTPANTNTPAQVESLLHSLERAAGGIGLHVNADKTAHMCFNQRGDISTLKGVPLKLMNKFTNFGSSVSSTENDINTRLAKAWAANDSLGLGYRSYGSHFQEVVVSLLLYGWTIWTLTKSTEKKLDGNCTRINSIFSEATASKRIRAKRMDWFGLVWFYGTFNHFRLFNAKSTFIHINSSTSSNSV